MTAPPDHTDLHAAIAALRAERDAALSEKAALAEELAAQTVELAERKSEFGERIAQQAAAIDVLKVMSASPGDPQPVFDLIVRRTTELCNGLGTALFEFDGGLVHYRAGYSMEALVTAANVAYAAAFPSAPTRGSISCRAILDREIVHIRDTDADLELSQVARELHKATLVRSQISIPLMRDGQAIGAISLAANDPGGFSDSQIELLKTFAEQAVIAITSAETYRALQTRTSDLQETLEYQTATSDLLKVISRSNLDLEPVFQTVAATAVRLCNAEQAGVYLHQNGEYRWVGGYSQLPEYERIEREVRIRPGTGTLVGRVALEGRPVHILDALADTLYEAKEDARVGAIHTLLGVPLLRDGSPIGVIGLGRQKIEPFTERQIELVSTFAAQAVIAMENARLLTEQREALEQQTATAEVLQVINASPGNLAPVFDAILEKAHSLCGAAIGSLMLYDGRVFRAVATRGYPEQYSALVREPFPPGVPHQALIRGDRLFHLPDMQAVAWAPGVEVRLRLFTELSVRSGLFVPLRKDGILLGVISAARQEVRPFSDKEIALLENFAAQAVIAMESARLLDELRQRTSDLQESLEYQTATSDVLKVMSRSTFDLKPVLDTLVETAARLCDADGGYITVREADAYRVTTTFTASPEYDSTLLGRLLTADDGSVTGRTALEGRIVHIHDVTADPGYALVQQVRSRTALGVPLLRGGVVIGTINLGRLRVRPFTERQIELVSTFADQAVIAMENARLLTEQREALEQQTATAEVLQVINASPGNLEPVFAAILNKAHTICGAEMGSLQIWDGTHSRALATLGYPEEIDVVLRQPSPPRRAHLDLIAAPRVFHVPDVTVEPALDERALQFRRLTGIRTNLLVPLRKDGVLLGFITANRREVRPFSDKEIALLENFADQAVIAMENARLLGELRQRTGDLQKSLEYQTATSDVLKVISRSTFDLQPVLDTVAETAAKLCNAEQAAIYQREGGSALLVANCGFPSEYEALVRGSGAFPLDLYPQAVVPRAIREGRTVHIHDVTILPGYGESAIRLGKQRTSLGVPLLREGEAIGAIVLARQRVEPFTDPQIELVSTFADQAVIAIENTRLLTEQREALEQQTATAEVLAVINASPGNLAPVFDAMLEKAMRLCGAAFGLLYTYDGELFHTVAHRGVPAALAEFRSRHPPSARPGGSAAPLIETMRPVHILDMMEQEFYRAGDAINRATVDLGGARTTLTVPLLKDDALLGVISIYRQEVRAFSAKQIALLESFGAQAVIAMENARLLDEIRQRQEELRITFENMGDGVAMFDETQHLVAWNRKFQEIFDVPDALLAEQRTYADYIRYLAERGEYAPEADPEEHVCRLIEQAGQPRTYERTRPDGRMLEIRHNPVPSGGFVLIYADITERKRHEAEIRAARDAAEEASRTIEAAYRELKTAQANLIQAEKMASLGQLTAGIAHEIKNPLNFVNNFAELSVDLLGELKDAIAPAEPALTEKQRAEIEEVSVMLTSNLEKITEHGKRADSIVKAILEHSRGSSGERRMVDLNALIDEALNLAYHGARAQDQTFNITLERDFGEDISPIEVNPQDMTRVFLNIFSNGFYATTRRARDGGDAGFAPTLRVTTRDTGDAVEIRVRDNGTGMTQDVISRVFEPFYSTKPTGEGTGLGLSITYDIVTQQHGGTITADSNVGEYSEFTIRLPRNP